MSLGKLFIYISIMCWMFVVASGVLYIIGGPEACS